LAAWLMTENLLILWALMMGLNWLILRWVFRRFAADFRHQQPAPGKQDLRALREIPIFVPAAAIHCLLMIVSIFIDYQYSKAAHATFGSAEALSGFFGNIYAAESVIAIALQFLLLGRLLNWLGVIGALMLQPLLLALACFGLWLHPGLWNATGARLADHVLQFTIYMTASNAIFGAVAPAIRGRLSVFLKVLLSPLCVALAGVVLMIATHFNWDTMLVPAILACIGLWGLATWMLRSRYLATLVGNLAEESEPSSLDSLEALSAAGERPRRMIKRLLRSPQADLVLLGLELAEELKAEALGKHVMPLLKHPDLTVRKAALATLQVLPLAELRESTGDVDPGIRALAFAMLEDAQVEGLATLARQRLAKEADAGVQALLLRFLHRRGLLQDADRAPLIQAAGDAAEARRVWAATALCGVYDERLEKLLLALLEDEARPVREAAIASAASRPVPAPWLIKHLVAGLVADIPACREALLRSGEAAVDALVGEWHATEDVQHRRRLLETLGHLGAPAHRWLSSQLEKCPEGLERDLVAALRHCPAEHHPSTLPAEREERLWVETSILKSVHDAFDQALLRETLQQAGDAQAVSLLVEEAELRIASARHLVFEKLALLVDGTALTSVTGYLERGRQASTRQRNLAVELFENLLPLLIREPVMAFIESPDAEALAEAARKHHRVAPSLEHLLEAELSAPDPWRRACAAYAAGRLQLLAPRVEALQHDPDPLVAETALGWAAVAQAS
ncbi:MAG: hypothetical protein ACYCW6_11105, partial [Candidatus Xenobia bacterium]